jgi:hypothetical protein
VTIVNGTLRALIERPGPDASTMKRFVDALKISEKKVKVEKVGMFVRKKKWGLLKQIIDPTESDDARMEMTHG